jgi:nicotinamidase/pyrazinamidase
MWPDHCVQGTYDAEFHPGLDLSKVAFIQQKGQDPEVDSYSAFRDNAADKKTGLDAWLAAQDIGQIDVCGLATDYCVKFSALDAKDMLPGVDVRFIEDASRGISSEGVAAAIAEMKAAGIQIAASTYVVGAEGGNG